MHFNRRIDRPLQLPGLLSPAGVRVSRKRTKTIKALLRFLDLPREMDAHFAPFKHDRRRF